MLFLPGYNGGQSDGVLNNINTMITGPTMDNAFGQPKTFSLIRDMPKRQGRHYAKRQLHVSRHVYFRRPETGAYGSKWNGKTIGQSVGWMNENNTFDLAGKARRHNNWESAVLNLTAGDKHLLPPPWPNREAAHDTGP